ncbi:hypothetical protein VTL71DRAFT_8543 [Oculimacula yallundae]|uniref:GPI anchored serine-rich protein n=1 Tax=Oculimacula yallundae TaxID=86028 RepID=A0ABR4D0A2_9HELO
MRFSVAAAAFLATAVSAGNVVYLTEEVTITSCGPTVTNCPASSTVVSTKTYPAVTTSASVPVVHPTGYANVSSPAVPTYPANTASTPVSVKVPVYSTSSPIGVASYAPSSKPVLSTMTISTCVPTVIYSTVTVTPTAPVVTKPVPTYAPAPSGTGVISYPHNATYPTATGTPPKFTGAASSVQGSMGAVAFAGLAAFIFA